MKNFTLHAPRLGDEISESFFTTEFMYQWIQPAKFSVSPGRATQSLKNHFYERLSVIGGVFGVRP